MEQTAIISKIYSSTGSLIFFGRSTISDLVDVIRKNRAEKFLLPANDVQRSK